MSPSLPRGKCLQAYLALCLCPRNVRKAACVEERTMDTDSRSTHPNHNLQVSLFLIALIILAGAQMLASLVQRDFGYLEVSNVFYTNHNGIPLRAKLLKPRHASKNRPLPGVVYIHGYQNNRETGDAYCIELARRGIVVLNIDAIGRGNSGLPGDANKPDFDATYGGKASLAYLRSLPYVNAASTGMMGHSLGAEMAYRIALEDPSVRGLVITGFAYTLDATPNLPHNMLMIIGKWDEFRDRMTGTRDMEREWMTTPQTRKVIPFPHPKPGVTYGDFTTGTARRVLIPRTIHVQESHNTEAIAESIAWMRKALQPPESLWIEGADQIWQIKEWATLLGMLAGLFSLLPLGTLLLASPLFRSLQDQGASHYACSAGSYFKLVVMNGIIMWLYLPIILVLFAVHIYVIPIDKAFPMMMVNGIVGWFVGINIIGFILFRFWFRRKSRREGFTLGDFGISYAVIRFSLGGWKIIKTIILAGILFAFVYLCQGLLESVFIVDFRFIFPFASDLTSERAWIALRYFPFILFGFLGLGTFLHGQIRPRALSTPFRTWIFWSFSGTCAVVAPLVLFLSIQYVPLFTTGAIPLVGPGGMFVSFVLNLFHIIGVLIMTTPISTWFYQLTGKIYLGALVNAMLVTWMFVSSQVIAPIPV